MGAADWKEVSKGFWVDSPFHLPDKQFFDWCAKNYSINRGVFNVVDSWFFDYGMKNIITRRQAMDQYLRYLVSNGYYCKQKLFLEFGKGGVKESLNCFAEKYLINQNSKGGFGEYASK